jgi:predicted enzyme related to lactoylglutathione lyase
MPRITHFEIPADNPDRAIEFYEKVFSWKFQKWDGPFDYWLIKTGEDDEIGINGGMMKRENNATVTNVIGVGDIDSSVQAVKDAGGTIVMEKHEIPDVGWIAYFKDPESNLFGIIEPKDM